MYFTMFYRNNDLTISLKNNLQKKTEEYNLHLTIINKEGTL